MPHTRFYRQHRGKKANNNNNQQSRRRSSPKRKEGSEGREKDCSCHSRLSQSGRQRAKEHRHHIYIIYICMYIRIYVSMYICAWECICIRIHSLELRSPSSCFIFAWIYFVSLVTFLLSLPFAAAVAVAALVVVVVVVAAATVIFYGSSASRFQHTPTAAVVVAVAVAIAASAVVIIIIIISFFISLIPFIVVCLQGAQIFPLFVCCCRSCWRD